MALPELTTPDSQLKWLSINYLLPYLSETRLRIKFVASPIVLELPWVEESLVFCTPVDKDHEVVSDSLSY